MDYGRGFQAFARSKEHQCTQGMDDTWLVVADVVDCGSVQNGNVTVVQRASDDCHGQTHVE